MSVLNRLRSDHHLDDAGLAALWSDGTLDGRAPAHPHLAACAACRTRFAELAAWLDDLRADTAAAADELFPADRLAAQQAQILRRLEAADRPARVIVFPGTAAPAAPRAPRVSRWIAAAAAAGLIVGVGVGQMMDFRQSRTGAPAGVEARLAIPAPEAASAESPAGDEAFLSELDASLAHPSVPPLRALDDFTPRAGETPR